MYRVFALLNNIEPPRVNDFIKEALRYIDDWYMEKEYSYIIIYGFDGAPHRLSKYADDHIVLYKMCWQIMAIYTKVS